MEPDVKVSPAPFDSSASAMKADADSYDWPQEPRDPASQAGLAGRFVHSIKGVLASFGRFRQHLSQDQLGKAGAWLLLSFGLLALFADFVAPYSPTKLYSSAVVHGPLWAESGVFYHPLGTDTIGRDLLSRLIYGGRMTLGIALLTTILTVVIGVALGLGAGLMAQTRHTRLAALLTRSIDSALAVPPLAAAAAVAGAWHDALIPAMMVASVFAMAPIARLLRAEVINLCSEQAHRGYDPSLARLREPVDRWQELKDTLSHCLPMIRVLSAFAFSDAILIVAALGFFGLGAAAPAAEWGTMVADGRLLWASHPWLSAAPALCIGLVIMSCHFVVGSLRSSLDDPHVRERL